MAELNARIIPKASGTAGEVPLASDLETAELAVNTADGTLFTKDVGGTVVTISGGGGGGGAVDSVNGETGVVSLGIQEMDDFELNEQTGVVVLTQKVTSSSNVSTSEKWAVYSSGSYIYYSPAQSALVDNLSVADEITLQVPGMATPFTTTIGAITGAGNAVAVQISPSAPDEVRNAANGTALTITSPNLPGSPLPLVEADILQWNDADQKFKPTLQGEVAASTDFADFQTRIAAL